MFKMTFGEYCFSIAEGYPNLYREYCERARLAEFFQCEDTSGFISVILVAKDNDWPFLVISQEYSPGPDGGFYPGIVFIPETHILFIGAGERLLAYRLELDSPKKIVEEIALGGFWGWRLHKEYVLMSSELELVAWDKYGKKCWSCFVEPPWSYVIEDDLVILDVMGKKTSFLLRNGPELQK
jgi:hypothetical protein